MAPALATDGTKWSIASDLDAQAITRGKAVFDEGSGALNAATGRCMDGSDIGSLAGAQDRARQDLACVVNRYIASKEFNLALTDAQPSISWDI